VGKVAMSVGEGLTGMAVEKLEPVMAVDAMSHPRYKFFPETGEERYHSFLGVPVLERGKPLGVLVVHTLRRRRVSAAGGAPLPGTSGAGGQGRGGARPVRGPGRGAD